MSTRPPARRLPSRVGGARYGGILPAKGQPGSVVESPAMKSSVVPGPRRTPAPGADMARDARGGARMVVLRREIGDVLRDARQRQGRTLREVSSAARVSLGYLSEVERGQKEASSELLGSICEALDIPLSLVLREVSDRVAVAEGLLIPDTIPAGPSRREDLQPVG